MCSAPNVYMFVYTLIGAQIVPLRKKKYNRSIQHFLGFPGLQYHEYEWIAILVNSYPHDRQ